MRELECSVKDMPEINNTLAGNLLRDPPKSKQAMALFMSLQPKMEGAIDEAMVS